jgi:hypothetical protein
MYNKLLNIMSSKGKIKGKGEKDKDGKGETLLDLLGD